MNATMERERWLASALTYAQYGCGAARMGTMLTADLFTHLKRILKLNSLWLRCISGTTDEPVVMAKAVTRQSIVDDLK